MLWKRSNVETFLVRLEAMAKAGVSLKDALVFLKKMGTTEKIAREGLWSMEEEGKTLSEGIRKYLTSAEYALLLAGEKSDSLAFAIQKVLYLRKSQKKIKSAFVGSMIYPVVVLLFVMVAIYYAGNNILPQLESAGLKLSGVLAFYKTLSSPVILFSVAGVIFLSVVGVIVFSTKFLGPYRKLTDRFLPFRIYRMWLGVIFLYMLSVLIKSGYTIADALEEIASSNPYFEWAVGEYLSYFRTSRNLGEAMKRSGFTLPDDATADLLEALSSFGKFEDRLIIIAEEMVEDFVGKAESYSKVASILALVFAGLSVGGFLFGMYGAVMNLLNTINLS